MRRVVVVGASGAGKSTLARDLALRLKVPHIELDALHWGPRWTEVPTEVRRCRAQAVIAHDGWTICGNYLSLRDLIWPRADTVIWLDYPMGLVLGRVVVRSVRRCVTGETLWAGNVETWSKTFLSNDSIIAWTWNSWRKQRREFPKIFRSPAYKAIRKYRFRSPGQTRDWLQQIEFEGSNAVHH
jgi:adenylate kinase family enzyme